MTEALIYCRMSRDRVGAGLGVDRQRQDCAELAARLGWTVRKVFTDNDMSAYSGKPRPGYLAMLAELDARPGNVVAWHTDRLHRSPAELETYIDLCERHGIATHCVTAGPLDLTTATGRMNARIHGAVARHEVEHAVERMKRAKLQAATAGTWKGGPRPFGFEGDGVTVRPAEADEIARASADLLAGVSLNAITRDWNDREIRTPSGNTWRPNVVRRVLMRARNAGLMEHRGEVVGPARWAAIVPEDTWHAVCAVLTAPDRTIGPGPERRWLGSGQYACGECGETLHVGSGGGNGKHKAKPMYRCSRRGRHVNRNAAALDDFVERLIVERLSRPDAAELVTAPSDKSARQARGEVSALRTRLDELADLYAAGDVDARQLARGTEQLRVKLADAEQRAAAVHQGDVLGDLAGAPDIAERWPSLPLSRRRAVLDLLMTVVVLRATRRGRIPGLKPGEPYFDPDSVLVLWHGPDGKVVRP